MPYLLALVKDISWDDETVYGTALGNHFYVDQDHANNESPSRSNYRIFGRGLIAPEARRTWKTSNNILKYGDRRRKRRKRDIEELGPTRIRRSR